MVLWHCGLVALWSWLPVLLCLSVRLSEKASIVTYTMHKWDGSMCKKGVSLNDGGMHNEGVKDMHIYHAKMGW